MSPSLNITGVELRWAPDRDRDAGLIAYVAVTLNESVRLDGITLRRARNGSSYLAFAHRLDSRGRERWYARPLTESAKREFEDAVRQELALQQSESEAADCRVVESTRPPQVARARRGGGAS